MDGCESLVGEILRESEKTAARAQTGGFRLLGGSAMERWEVGPQAQSV